MSCSCAQAMQCCSTQCDAARQCTDIYEMQQSLHVHVAQTNVDLNAAEQTYADKTHNKTYKRTQPVITVYISIAVILIASLVPVVYTQLEYDWYREQTYMQFPPLWYNFDSDVVVRTYYGDVRGFSVPWHIEDVLYYDPLLHYMPRWYLRRVNCFLGVPYAEPPLGQLRFQRPFPPRWGGTWNAQYYRPACPQQISYIQQYIPTFTAQNISEDCLYLNIFAPNVTAHSRRTLYPVLVWFHPGEFVRGTSQIFPGHVIAQKMMVVVTVNYRLGPLGFLSTEDDRAPGNWGMFDQNLALKFVKENIRAFKGDPTKITIAGSEAGAASVGLHMVSPLSRSNGYFHKAMMLSGSDMSRFAYVDPFWRPREYAYDLAERLDCDTDDSYSMINCMRDNNTITWQMILYHAQKMTPHDGKLGRIWGPTQDAGYERVYHASFLPELPHNLRTQNKFDKIPVLMGINRNEGVEFANRSLYGLGSGLSKTTFSQFMKNQLMDWRIRDLYRERAYESLEFQYTYWPDPANKSARAQMFIDLISDLDFGAGMDFVVKQQCEYEDAYFYEFNYKSWNDWSPKWMGVGFDAISQFFFGYPFMNETVLNETELVGRQWYDYEDRNISDFVMYMFTNFAKYGIPTPNVTRNITWEPFNPYNLTYLVIDWESNLWFRYRQSKYAFWNEYFPYIARQEYYYPTATPTPAGRPYIYATGAMATLLAVLLVIVGVCIYLLVSESRRQRREEEGYGEAPQRGASMVPLSLSELSGYKSHDTSMAGSSKSGKTEESQLSFMTKEPSTSDYPSYRMKSKYPTQQSRYGYSAEGGGQYHSSC